MAAFDMRLSPLLRQLATDRCLRYAAFAANQAARHGFWGFRLSVNGGGHHIESRISNLE
jgi:hypothetical protein